MKRAKPMLATLAALAGFFVLASPAYADNFRCPMDQDSRLPDIPDTSELFPYAGSIDVIRTTPGDCIVTKDIYSNISITFTVPDGKLEVQKLVAKTSLVDLKVDENDVTVKGIIKAGTHVRIQAGFQAGATTGNIELQQPLTINATETQDDVPEVHGNVLLRAWGNIKTKDISTGGGFDGGGAKTGGVQIDAHQGSGQNVPFTIGADTVNGVNGTINTETVIGGSTNPFSLEGGVRIKNGVLALLAVSL